MNRIRVTMEFDTPLNQQEFNKAAKNLVTSKDEVCAALVYLSTEVVPATPPTYRTLHDRRHVK